MPPNFYASINKFMFWRIWRTGSLHISTSVTVVFWKVFKMYWRLHDFLHYTVLKSVYNLFHGHISFKYDLKFRFCITVWDGVLQIRKSSLKIQFCFCFCNSSTFWSQNLSFWNLDFHISPGPIFQEARIQNFVIDKEHKSSQHLFEQ